MDDARLQRTVVVLVAVWLLLAALPGVAAAQERSGGTVVVEEGETVSEVNAVGGTIVVRGTVTGDVTGLAGNVVVEGTVQGDLSVAAGNVRIAGEVQGDVSAGAGSVVLEEGGTVGGNFEAGAGNVRIDGAIQGDATVGAETITLGENASIAGSLTYDGELVGNRDAVAGDVTEDPTIGVGLGEVLLPIAAGVFAIYAFLFNLLLGAALLLLFPGFSEGVVDRVRTTPLRSGLLGLGFLVGVPLLLIALAITIVGIPFTILGAFVFAFVVWIALVYGRYAVGRWLLSIADVENRWAGLVTGLLVGAVLSVVPFVGGLFNTLVFLLGLGALAAGLYARGRYDDVAPASVDS